MAQDRQTEIDLHTRLGYKRLSRTWAKAELFLGLAAAGAGLFLGVWAVTRTESAWEFAIGGWVLFVLGSYLTLAGHRSHLYQSGNERAAYLAEEIRRLKGEGGLK
jgi:hypothetical protein